METLELSRRAYAAFNERDQAAFLALMDEDVEAESDVVLSRLRARGHGAGSETPLVDPAWQPAHWRDGKCVWWRVCAAAPPSAVLTVVAIEDAGARRMTAQRLD